MGLGVWWSVGRVGAVVLLLVTSFRSFGVAVVREGRELSPRRECWRDIEGRLLTLSLVASGWSEVFEELREGGPTKRWGAGRRWGLMEVVWEGLFTGEDILVGLVSLTC
jgi:hypothetical protein